MVTAARREASMVNSTSNRSLQFGGAQRHQRSLENSPSMDSMEGARGRQYNMTTMDASKSNEMTVDEFVGTITKRGA